MNLVSNVHQNYGKEFSFTSNVNNKKPQKANIKYLEDSFDSELNQKEDKSTNGKFDISEAGKNLLKGLVSPVSAMVKHPVATFALLGATVAATTMVPVLGPIMAIGFGAYSLYQVGKGTYDAAKNYKNGNYDEAEKSFDKIGQGIVGSVLSALGMKQSAKVVREAKMMSELNLKSLTHAQRKGIATEVDNNGFVSALKDNVSLFTSKRGLKSIAFQFKPSTIKTRFVELVDVFKGNRIIEEEHEIYKSKKVKREEFKKSAEGIRRSKLSDEEIKQEVTALYEEAFDKLGVPKEQRPVLKVKKAQEKHGGSYTKAVHELEINPEAYKAGTFELEDVIMHEATHCEEALLRAGIPQERVNQIVREELVSRVINGESEKILIKGNIIGPDMMTPPKMSPKMKQEFIKFADSDLYTDSLNSDLIRYVDSRNTCNYSFGLGSSDVAAKQQKVQPLLDKIQAMIDANPDFTIQYGGNYERAMNALTDYSLSHNVRYNIFTDVKIPNMSKGWKNGYITISELQGEQLSRAEESLVGFISTTEGNSRISGLNGWFADSRGFNQYQFSPEEVLAQKNGNNFAIEKFTAKIAEMKANGTLTEKEEARLLAAIEKAKTVIEYKTKGLDYYEKYTQMVNNPDDKNLAKVVSELEKELKALKSKISKKDYETITEVITVIKKIPDIATTVVPSAMIYSLVNLLKGKEDEKVA